ncbi:hypothetical protein LWI29_005492 [Acer saccharum]|uniref:Uncharacterized protein n=1 Tax=Acer saccharum TaxID=4024 RepID=A0AA39RC33_ACESA|nr:hypothetical protein LWI29_005492 [Acer saccharum]
MVLVYPGHCGTGREGKRERNRRPSLPVAVADGRRRCRSPSLPVAVAAGRRRRRCPLHRVELLHRRCRERKEEKQLQFAVDIASLLSPSARLPVSLPPSQLASPSLPLSPKPLLSGLI